MANPKIAWFKNNNNGLSLLLLAFIVVKFLLQYILFNPYYELHRDEFLHLDQAKHLAWGYLSVPPATSWIAWVIQLLGNSVFWIKFFPALFGALTLLIVWKTVEELKGNLFAFLSAATGILLSALIRLNFLFQPNSLDVLSWTAFYFCLVKYFNTRKPKWLFIAAVVCAFGFLNKYNIVFLLIGLAPAILLTQQRNIFGQKKFFIAAATGFAIILPNLLWQYHNHFPVFYHLKLLADTQLVNVNRLDFLKEQVFYFVGGVPVIIASLYALLVYEPFKKYRFFFWAFIFTLAVFVYLRAKSYYAIGLYPIYISFGSVYLGNILRDGWKKYLRPVIVAIPVIFYVLLFNIFYRIQSPQAIFKRENVYTQLGLLRWEDGKNHSLPQDFADMLGWKELAAKIDTIYGRFPDSEQTMVLCDNYGQAGAINYYTHNKKLKAVSFHADYVDWFKLDRKIDNVIRVKESEGSDKELAKTGAFFKTAFIAGSVTNPLAREYGTIIFVFSGPKIDINERIRMEIQNAKSGT